MTGVSSAHFRNSAKSYVTCVKPPLGTGLIESLIGLDTLYHE